MNERILDPRLINLAEDARQKNKVIEAAQLVAEGLKGLSNDKIEAIVQDKSHEDLRILAGLSRIGVDSLKTAANQSIWPPTTLRHLGKASGIINTVYHNPLIELALQDVHTDYYGNLHYFGAEMQRDHAKTIFASTVLYPNTEAEQLTRRGERFLYSAQRSVSYFTSTNPLIAIELQLSMAGRGVAIKSEDLLHSFDHLQEQSHDNPHRVATVASWLVAWGNKLQNEDIRNAGEKVYKKLIKKYPEWDYMVKNENKKLQLQKRRRDMFKILTPITTNQEKRTILKRDLSGLK